MTPQTNSPVRVGIVGMGTIGKYHANHILGITPGSGGGVQNATVSALCSRRADDLPALINQFGGPARVRGFSSYDDMLRSGACDAVLICTPHTDHPEKTLQAFDAGLHVMVEKPLGVSIKAARDVIAAYTRHLARHPHLKFAIMFNQRTNPLYQKLRALLANGDLGLLTRITWIATHWFRPNSYYASSSWRATWKGEGGGVVINQCAHNLDLLQWIVAPANLHSAGPSTPPTGREGLPIRVTAVGGLGKRHPIETEDELSALFEFPSVAGAPGAIGHFITSTGEFPGTNRLEICGTRGKVIAENNKLLFTRSSADSRDFAKSSPEPFSTPDSTQFEIPITPPGSAPGAPSAGSPTPSEHQLLMQDFIDAIVDNRPNYQLLAPGTEAPKSLELGNAMLLAAFGGNPVPLPLNADHFESFLQQMIRKNTQ